MNPAYEKFDTNGDCKECGYHITWHKLQAGSADCQREEVYKVMEEGRGLTI